MALKEEAAAAPEQEANRMSPEDERDLKIAVLLGEQLIDQGGIDVINKAVSQSKDPGQIIGQFLMQLVVNMNEKLGNDMELSKAIYLAHGGWVEQISDYLQEQYDVPKQVMDRAEIYIASSAKQMAEQGAAQGPGAPPAQEQPGAQPQGPAMPQGGMQ